VNRAGIRRVERDRWPGILISSRLRLLMLNFQLSSFRTASRTLRYPSPSPLPKQASRHQVRHRRRKDAFLSARRRRCGEGDVRGGPRSRREALPRPGNPAEPSKKEKRAVISPARDPAGRAEIETKRATWSGQRSARPLASHSSTLELPALHSTAIMAIPFGSSSRRTISTPSTPVDKRVTCADGRRQPSC